jgi:predicted ArsR family transcriptional regulator
VDGYIELEGAIHHSWHELLSHPLRLEVVACMAVLGSAAASELAQHCGGERRSLRRQLEALVAAGLVHERAGASDGVTNGRPAARFFLDARTREGLIPLLRLLERPLEPWPRRIPLPAASP